MAVTRNITVFLVSTVQIKVPIAANWKGVCLQNTSKPHSCHLKKMGIIMTLWKGIGAVLENFSQWQ